MEGGVIHTDQQYLVECEREQQLRNYLRLFRIMEKDILDDAALTKDDKEFLLPSDQIVNAQHFLNNLNNELDEYQERA
jgi:hypothetical protein